MAEITYRSTDVGNAQRFVDRFGDRMRYCPEMTAWFIWDGRRWAEDTQNEVERLAKLVARSLFEQADQLEGDARTALYRWALRTESGRGIREMIALARSEFNIQISPRRLDQDAWLLNTLNGTIELKTGECRQSSRQDFITKVARVEYDREATAPTWEQFLQAVFRSDTETIRFMQRALGATLIGENDDQVAFVLWGTGSNGKSTLLELVAKILGDYAVKVDASTLMERGRDSSNAPSDDVARMMGARLVRASETAPNRRFNEALLKDMSGGEPVTCRRMYGRPFEFTPSHKMFLTTNHRPVIQGTDEGIWRRIRLIPFRARFQDGLNRDLGLLRKLVQEKPGILNWLIQGCLMWQAEGLGGSETIRVATLNYRRDMDRVGGFLQDSCEVAPGLEESPGALWQAYTRWHYEQDDDQDLPTQRKIAAVLREKGFETGRGNRGRFYKGLRVRTEIAVTLSNSAEDEVTAGQEDRSQN